MTKEQFEKALELHKESDQLTSARGMVGRYGIFRGTQSISDLLTKKHWQDSDKRISEMVVKEIDIRLAEIEKEIESL